MNWTIAITQIDAQLWSVYGELEHDQGVDHMGSNVVGDEQTAREFAANVFGADATVTVDPLAS